MNNKIYSRLLRQRNISANFLLNIVNADYYRAIGSLLKKALINRDPQYKKDNDAFKEFIVYKSIILRY